MLRNEFELLNKYKTSNYTRQCLKDLASLFSKRFAIPLDSLYNEKTNLVFFVKLIKDKKKFDIEQIKLDIINAKDLEELAVEYKEPLYVIEEINDNIETLDYKIVSSKIYNRQELEVVFNSKLYFGEERLKLLDKIAYIPYKNNKNNLLWLGSDIIKNYNKIIVTFLENTDNIQHNEKYIKLTTAAEILDIPFLMLHNYLKNKKELFGVVLTSIADSNNCVIYLKEEDVMKIKSNLKFYINKSELLKKINKKQNVNLITLFINNITDKKVDIRNKYIKKEDAIYMLKINELIEGNLNKYRSFLISNIINSGYTEFKLKTIIRLFYKGTYTNRVRKLSINYKDKISKLEALEIIADCTKYVK